jgi:predicted transcriptional regulator of viral defense system
MSTVKSNITQKRFAALARMGEKVFHVDDLANLWQISDKNTLHTTLKRYAQKGLLFRIFRGLYAIDDPRKLDPYLLGCKALNRYCYVSVESVLEKHGIIAQKISCITLISDQSRRFEIAGNQYYCRKLSDLYLFNPIGIKERNGVKWATLERAMADLLYFNSHYHFDAEKMLNWNKTKQIQREIGYGHNN